MLSLSKTILKNQKLFADSGFCLISTEIPLEAVIILGHEGCYLKTQDVQKYFSATICTPVDSTGGADAFISSLASYLIEGYSLEHAIRIAIYAASLCVTRQGVIPALADRNTTENYIKKFEPELI